MNHSNVIEKKS